MDLPTAPSSPPQLNCLPSLYPLRILATEDQAFHQELLKRALTRHAAASFQIEADGESTLAVPNLDTYDILLLDLMLPDMDGIELARQLRKKGVSAPMIAITAGTMTYTPEICLEAGFAAFLAKPYSPIGLAEKIREICPVE